MRKMAFFVAAASLFAVAPIAHRFGVVASSLLLVWLGVLAAAAATNAFTSFAVASGALGAFASGVLAAVSPATAGAVMMGFAFAERTSRVRDRTARAVHVLLALVSGAMAGSIAFSFAPSTPLVYGVAIAVAAILASLPLLVAADDAVAHALAIAARDVDGPARATLLEGAELRRRSVDVPLDADAAERVQTTWKSLVRLAEVRGRLARTRPLLLTSVDEPVEPTSEEADGAPAAEGMSADAPAEKCTTADALAAKGTSVDAPAVKGSSVDARAAKGAAAKGTTADTVAAMVDQRIREHVRVLARAYSAVDTAIAAATGLDDVAQKSVESMNESLDEVSRALVEVRGGDAA